MDPSRSAWGQNTLVASRQALMIEAGTGIKTTEDGVEGFISDLFYPDVRAPEGEHPAVTVQHLSTSSRLHLAPRSAGHETP